MISQNMDSVLNRGIVSGYWATFLNVIYPTAWLYYDWLQASSYMTVSDWLLPHYIVIFLRQCMFLDDWNWTVNIYIYWILCRLYCIYRNLSLLDFVIISSYTLMDLCFMEHVFSDLYLQLIWTIIHQLPMKELCVESHVHAVRNLVSLTTIKLIVEFFFS